MLDFNQAESARRKGGRSGIVAITLDDLQDRVDGWISQFREGYFSPMTLVVRLSEELGELAREVNHQFGEKPKKATEEDGDIALELADMMFVIACLANRLGIRLEDAFVAVMEKFETRDANRWTRIAGDKTDLI